MDTSDNNWLHSPHSEMHEAIFHYNVSRIRELHENKSAAAGIFCFGNGDNCFVLAARKCSASTDVVEREAYWRILYTILLLEPKGIDARNSDGLSLLMFFLDDVTKVEKLVSLGADVNAVNFTHNQSAIYITSRRLREEKFLMTFRFLLSSGAILSPDLLDRLGLVLQNATDKEYKLDAARCLMEIMQHPAITANTLLRLCCHPLELLWWITSHLSCAFSKDCKAVLQNLKSFDSVMSGAKLMIYTVEITEFIKHKMGRFFRNLKLADTLYFDQVSYFLFSRNLNNLREENIDEVAECLQMLLDQNLVNTTNKEVVSPLHALLYNINLTAGQVHQENYLNWSILMSRLLYKCMEKLKDDPLPHESISLYVIDHHNMYYPHTTLDVLALIIPLLVSDVEHLLDCVMALLQLSHEHPYKIVSFWLYYVFILVSRRKRDLFEKKFVPKFISRVLGSCGTLTTIGIATGVKNQCKPFYDNLVEVCVFCDNQRLENIKTSALLSKNDVSSLKWLSIMKIRKQLFLNRKDCRTTLPHSIRSLLADGLLPRSLERDLLVYAPN